ncbi:MAG: HD domain-containing protein [Solirubrobacterales bacterium]
MKSKIELFQEFSKHLLEDQIPSQYFNYEFAKEETKVFPFELLKSLKYTEQSLKYHPEGNVWNHTMLVLDQAAYYKNESKNPVVFMWGALLHDIGKPAATKKKKSRITAYGHDIEGEKLAKEFLMDLTDDMDFINEVAALVRWHMQILYVLKDLPYSDIKAMLKEVDLNEVALLSLCDRIGRTGANINEEKKNMKIFIKNIQKIVDNI